jgi:hypothetical protein
VHNLDLASPGWRLIDADAIKQKLLEAAVHDGVFASVSTRTLAAGYPVMLNEISSLVHNESVFLTNALIERCLEARENVVIKGTLSWVGLPQRYLRLLEQNSYLTVSVLDVDVDQATALENAFEEWAAGRAAAIQGENNCGGRFTPRGAITSNYDPSGRYSICNQNAVDFFNSPKASGFDDVELIISTGSHGGLETYRRLNGQDPGPAPRYLKDRAPEARVSCDADLHPCCAAPPPPTPRHR